MASQSPTDQENKLRGTSEGVEDKKTYCDVAQIREQNAQKDVDNDDGPCGSLGETKNIVLVVCRPDAMRFSSKSVAYRKDVKSRHVDCQEDRVEAFDAYNEPNIEAIGGQRPRLQLNQKYF